MSIQFVLGDQPKFEEENMPEDVQVILAFYDEILKKYLKDDSESQDREQVLWDQIMDSADKMADFIENNEFANFYQELIDLMNSLNNEEQFFTEKQLSIQEYLVYLITSRDQSGERQECLQKYCDYIKNIEGATIQYKIGKLGELFNTLDQFPEEQQQLFNQILTYSSENNKISMLKNSIRNIDNIVASWQLSESKIREFYLNIIQYMNTGFLTEDLKNELMLKYINSFQTDSLTEQEQQKVTEFLSTLLTSDNLLLIPSTILQTKAFQFLQKKNHDIASVISFFIRGNFTGYSEFIKKNPNAIKNLNLEDEQVSRIIRVKSIPQILETGDVIKFDEFAKRIQVQTEESEEWIVLAIQYNLLEAQIDQYNETICILSNNHKYFDVQEWKELDVQLSETIQKLTQVLGKL